MKAPTMVAIVMMWFASLAACTYEDPDLGKKQQAEIIEVHGGCPPGTIGNGEICVDPLEGGGDGGGGGGPTGGEGSPGGGGGGGGETCPSGDGGCGRTFDPEPDRNKDRNSCDDWCHWNMRQCLKECNHRYPDPLRDIGARNRCITACKKSDDPNHGLEACRSDCQKRFPGRPITTVAP